MAYVTYESKSKSELQRTPKLVQVKSVAFIGIDGCELVGPFPTLFCMLLDTSIPKSRKIFGVRLLSLQKHAQPTNCTSRRVTRSKTKWFARGGVFGQGLSKPPCAQVAESF